MNRRISAWIAATVGAACMLAGTSARADQYVYAFVMDGPSERPANASPGAGTGTAIYDDIAGTLSLTAAFSGLTGNVTQTHFHAVTATSGLPDNSPPGETLAQAANAVLNVPIAVGAPSLPGFPIGGTSGVYSQVLNLNSTSIYNATFLSNNGGVAGARSVFVQALADAKTYWNIHSNTFPGGEIRGFPTLVRIIPEPTSIALAGAGMLAIVFAARRSRKV